MPVPTREIDGPLCSKRGWKWQGRVKKGERMKKGSEGRDKRKEEGRKSFSPSLLDLSSSNHKCMLTFHLFS